MIDASERKPTHYWRWIVGALAAVILLFAIAFVVLWVSYPRTWWEGGNPRLMQQSASPNGRWTLRVYDINPGAMAPEWYRADLVDHTGEYATRDVFHVYDPGDSALWTKDGNHFLIRWKSNSVVSLGGHAVNVLHGHWGN